MDPFKNVILPQIAKHCQSLWEEQKYHYIVSINNAMYLGL